MTSIQAVILGVIQGITEFLPISSSGHLIIFPATLGWREHPLAFDILLHLATFCAIILYFRRDWVMILRGGILSIKERKLSGDTHRILFWYILLASVPVMIFGSMAAKSAEYYFRNPVLVALMLGIFGVVLYVSEAVGRKEKSLEDITWQIALLIGLAQMFAIIPGVSRSGITISAAIALGMKRDGAVRFSFLLGAPIIFAAACYSLLSFEGIREVLSSSGLLWGFAASFISSMAAIHFLLKFIRRYPFTVFAVYRVIISIILAIIFIGK